MIKTDSDTIKPVIQAWNTIYNVLHLNRLANDPEEAARSLRHPLISILDLCDNGNDDDPVIDYLSKNEILLFLSSFVTMHHKNEPYQECCNIIIAFFAYLCRQGSVKMLSNVNIADAIQIVVSFDSKQLVLANLLPRLSKSEQLKSVYLTTSLIRHCLEPILQNGDLRYLKWLCHIVDDDNIEFSDLTVYTKALAVYTVNAVMTPIKGAISLIDDLFVDDWCQWTRFRVAFVESFRRHCVDILADTDPALLLIVIKEATQPELLVPTGTKLLQITKNFAEIELVAEKCPHLVFTEQPDDEVFAIDRQELAQVVDKTPEGAQLYQQYHEFVQKRTIKWRLKKGIRKLAMDSRVIPDGPLERLLLQAVPIPVCMPASPRVCAYYLAYLQHNLLHSAQ